MRFLHESTKITIILLGIFATTYVIENSITFLIFNGTTRMEQDI